MQFEEKLRKYIRDRYNTYLEAATVLKISQTQISQYLNGKAKPGYPFLKELAEVGCDMNWLLRENYQEEEKPVEEKIIEGKKEGAEEIDIKMMEFAKIATDLSRVILEMIQFNISRNNPK